MLSKPRSIKFIQQEDDRKGGTLRQEVETENKLASVYELKDPRSWDPFSRAERMSRIFSFAAAPQTSDDDLKSFLDVVERKIRLTLGNSTQQIAELRNYEHKRTLFNYKILPPFRATNQSIEARRPKYSHVSEYLLAAILVSTVSYLRNLPSSSRNFLRYDKALRTKGAWIEDTFLDTTSRVQNTFLLNYIIEKKLFEEKNSRDVNGEVLLPLNLSNEVLQEILDKLGKSDLFRFADLVPGKAGLDQQELDLKKGNFAALLHVHHEISENAMAHGVNSHLNPIGSDFDHQKMGMIFFVEMAEMVLTRNQVDNQVSQLPPEFKEYHSAVSKRNTTTYSIYSYYDNGVGIQAHLKSNKTTASESIGIAEIMKRNLTTRQITGSGAGLSKIRDFSDALKAFLTIDTPTSSYTFDGATKRSTESMVARIRRGTMISLYLPRSD